MKQGKGAETDGLQGAGALQRGLTIVEILIESPRSVTLHEIAEMVNLSDSTVHRILRSLKDAGYVMRDASGKRYHATAKAFSPMTMYHPLQILRRDAFDAIRNIRAQTELSSSLVIFVGNERLVLDVSGVSGVLTPYFEMRLQNPLHVAVTGKLLVLSRAPDERKSLLGDAPYEALTPNTLTDPDDFERELETITEKGFATSLDENFVGFSAIGAAVTCGTNQTLGCVTLAGASKEFTPDRIAKWGDTLQEQARLISFSPGARATYSMFS